LLSLRSQQKPPSAVFCLIKAQNSPSACPHTKEFWCELAKRAGACYEVLHVYCRGGEIGHNSRSADLGRDPVSLAYTRSDLYLCTAEINSRLTIRSSRIPRQCPTLPIKYFVGVPRIELGSRAPEARILPLYYTPTKYLIPNREYLPRQKQSFYRGYPCTTPR